MNDTSDMKREAETAAVEQLLSQDVESLEWDLCDIEEMQADEAAPDTRSSTDSKDSKDTKASCSHIDDWDTDASSVDEFEDAFEYISQMETVPKTIDDLQQLHAVHVAGSHQHIVPPYRIKGEIANLLTTTFHPDSPEGQAIRAKYRAEYEKYLKEYEAEPDPQYDHWELDRAIENLNDPRKFVKVVHIRGYTEEIHVYAESIVCDETCPQFVDSMAKQVGRAAQRLRRDWWDDLDLGSLF